MPRQRQFYRWVSNPAELRQFQAERIIQTLNLHGLGTYFTSERYATPIEALTFLALPAPPRHVVGPIPEDEMPEFDIVARRRVEPGYGQPGGGVEYCTSATVHVFGWYDFNQQQWSS